LKIIYTVLLGYYNIYIIKRQGRFCSSASFILQIPHSPHDYRPVMNKLKLLSLADRRVDANLVFLHKLIDERVDAPFLLSLINFKVSLA
jgi:hypothetical protein